ncbi:MAG: DUF4333 domain-containing protein [Actinomycetota bacterium]|nr:DUF4333 domain-containing protein [Actinomycetota bacterium]
MKRNRVVAVAGSALAALLIAGCSSGEPDQAPSSAPAVDVFSAPASDDPPDSGAELMDVDARALATGIAKAAGVPAEKITVDCPETYPNEVGHTFECGLNDGSKDFTVTVTVTDLAGGVEFEITAEGLPD